MGIPVKYFDETTWAVNTINATAANALTSTGSFCGLHIHNENPTDVYVHIYNALAADVTVGTTAPIRSLEIPAGGSREESVPSMSEVPCSTAISYAATNALAGATFAGTALSGKVFFKKLGLT